MGKCVTALAMLVAIAIVCSNPSVSAENNTLDGLVIGISYVTGSVEPLVNQNVFEFYGTDFVLGEWVSVTMNDNGTPNDITDDLIVHAERF